MIGQRGLRAISLRLSYEREIQALLSARLETLVEGATAPVRILDVGCGRTSMLEVFNGRPARRRCHLIGLDVHEPTVSWGRLHGFHDEYVLADARDHRRLPDVDVIVATDLIEHLDKPDAVALIGRFEAVSTLAVLLLTPNGFIDNPFTADNPFMAHRCGFSVDDLEALGYDCVGLGGPKALRGPHALPRGPRLLAVPGLAVASRLLRRSPRHSFHLLAQKSRRPGV